LIGKNFKTLYKNLSLVLHLLVHCPPLWPIFLCLQNKNNIDYLTFLQKLVTIKHTYIRLITRFRNLSFFLYFLQFERT